MSEQRVIHVGPYTVFREHGGEWCIYLRCERVRGPFATSEQAVASAERYVQLTAGLSA